MALDDACTASEQAGGAVACYTLTLKSWRQVRRGDAGGRAVLYARPDGRLEAVLDGWRRTEEGPAKVRIRATLAERRRKMDPEWKARTGWWNATTWTWGEDRKTPWYLDREDCWPPQDTSVCRPWL